MREARTKLLEVKELLSQGKNPTIEKKKHIPNAVGTFQEVALDWLEKQKNKWSDGHRATNTYRLEHYIFNSIGAFQIYEITAPQVLHILRKLEE